ncbi:MAG: cobalt ABC transporter ATP-binding protein [Planctomycetes bacterium DG_23]|nr:MAG: cobalt ABC transporter ATP-binding protein [Planctomycetes bacterium DG_23]
MKEAVRIENLHYTYPEGTQALKGISLRIYEGESVGIIGPNGAGKSTLLLHLNGILPAAGQGEGRVVALGEEIRRNDKRIRSDIGFVFEDPDEQLFMPRVFDDVAFGPLNMGLSGEEVKARVKDALRAVNLAGFEERSPHHLSAGEKRAAAIATVLSMRPQILVIDEPASDLDPRSRRNIIHLLNTFRMTKMIATHDLDMVLEVATRCILLDEGKVIKDGPGEEVLKNRELLEAHGLEMPLSLLLRSQNF